ncbi:MAG: diguanylate cyclase [Actinomycetota bacterium]|jgi:diguanylate cyclase (GGDEF)-like protein|nr:diguanylate cyclase [Actinomycetota bacterium]
MPTFMTVRPEKLRLDGQVWPFGAICVLALSATLLRTQGTDWTLVLVAALVALSLAAAAGRIRGLSVAVLVLPFAVDGILALLRQAQGGSTSGYAPLAILPVIWVGLTRGPRSVAAMTVCTFAMFAVPILALGDPLYPTTGWRSVVLWTIVAAAVGVGARRVVSEQRRLTAVADDRAAGLDRLVTAQTAVSTADHDADAVMRTVAREAMTLVGSDAACVELLEGDEVVCTAGAGAAIEWVGLRLRAADSITGECFRTGKVLICTDSEADSRVAREACRAVGARSLIVVPLTHADEVKGVLIAWSSTADSFSAYQVQLLSLLANTSGAALDRAGLIAMLTEHAVTDELTNLPNRRAWKGHLEQALARSRRTRDPLSVLLLDLDGFKEVNDRQGHAAGDQLLVDVSQAWLGALRETDVLGRLGGDEFAAVLERADEVAAIEVVARLRAVMPPPHRASMGLAVWDGDETAQELLARADVQMYQRKAASRSAS